MAKTKATIISELNAYLYDSAGVSSIKPSFLNGSITDLLDSLASQEDGVKGIIKTLTPSATTTIDLSLGNHFKITLDQNITLDYTNAPSSSYGATYVVEVTQDSTGSRTLGYASGKFLSAGSSDIESGGDTISEIWLRWNGSKMVVNTLKNLTDL